MEWFGVWMVEQRYDQLLVYSQPVIIRLELSRFLADGRLRHFGVRVEDLKKTYTMVLPCVHHIVLLEVLKIKTTFLFQMFKLRGGKTEKNKACDPLLAYACERTSL